MQLWKWLVLDMSLGYVWALDYDDTNEHKGTDLDYFPVRAVLMYQPDIPIKSIENFSLRPYAGIGPMFAINGTKADFYTNCQSLCIIIMFYTIIFNMCMGK